MTGVKQPEASYYWDSCLFIHLIEGSHEIVPTLELLLNDADEGKVVIVTSMLTITEVVFAKEEKDAASLSVEVEKRSTHCGFLPVQSGWWTSMN